MDEKSKKFEQTNIQKLQEERVKIQKKTFTKWMNCHLKRAGMEVDDLFLDLADGKVLLKLMEVISDAKLGKPNRGVLRVQKIENVNKALKYIQSKVTLENIGAEDIVDCNPRLILGLIWTIILRFQIQEMIIENESGEKKSAKDALLLWCQNKTRGYKNVDIKDFSKSWRDGLAFNALIHAHCPDLVNYDKIVPEQHQKNLSEAFSIAEKELGVPSLLDPEDVDVDKPDDKSILTYVSSLYLTFAKMKTENTGAKRVGKIMSNALEIAQMIEDYEKLVRDLLQWIMRKIAELNNRNFPNSLSGMQADMQKFKQYRTIEKPPKFSDRSTIDEKLFQIIIKQKQNQMKNYVPPEGLLLKEVEVAWDNLEKAEHARELALRAELVRQEKLQQAAEKFNKKAILRETWLNDIFIILSKIDTGSNIQNIEAQINKEELIGNDITTTKERFQKLGAIVRSLEDNNYHDRDTISKRNEGIQRRWQDLQTLMANRQLNADKLQSLIAILRTIHTIRLEFDDLYPQIKSSEVGKHLMAAEDLLERHNIIDRQLKTLSDRFKNLEFKANNFLESPKANTLTNDQKDTVVSKLLKLNDDINGLIKTSQDRREQLAQNCNFHKLWTDLEEEEAWLTNQIQIMTNKNVGNDLPTVLRQIRRHQVYEAEIEAHSSIFNKLRESAKKLSLDYPLSAKDIEKRITLLSNGWGNLERAKCERRNLLKDAHECQKYYADADDAEQWMTEHFPLVLNKETGDDVGTSKALSKRHDAICEEISTFGLNDMKRLNELATLMTKPLEKHNIRPEMIAAKTNNRDSISLDYDVNVVNNMIQIPVEEDSEYESEEGESDDSEMVVAISDYQAMDKNNRDISLVKGEAYRLLKKKDSNWWLVETKDKKKGFAPANHLQPKVKIRKQKSKSKAMVNKWVPIDSDLARKHMAKLNRKSVNEQIFKGPQTRTSSDLHFDKANIEKRQNDLDKQYQSLVGLAKGRAVNLNGSILSNQFFRECDNFETWMKEKEIVFNQRDSIASDVEGMKKKYEAIIDELAANSGRISDINEMVKDLNNLDPKSVPEVAKLDSQQLSKIPFPVDKKKVNQRHKDVQSKWDQLNKLKCEKERSLAGASSIDLFNKIGDELAESMNQKIEILDDNNVGFDKASNEALQRKLQNLLLEIEPIKERMEKFKYIGDGVKSTYPTEKKYVDDKIRNVQDLYDKLQKAINKRSSDLNNSSNVHKFLNDAKDIDDKLDDLHGTLDNPIIPKDVQSAESCIEQHKPLKYEIEASQASIDKLNGLANEVLKDRPNDKNIISSLDKLKEKLKSLKDKEKNRDKDLNNSLEAQKFYKECDQVELIAAQQACKLDTINPQASVDDVERALKNHDNLSAVISQLDNRVKDLEEHKKDLTTARNPNSDKISGKLKNVEDKMNALHNKRDKKKLDLENDLKFAKFKESADELDEWIEDKMIAVHDENYKDLHNLAEKLQKHKGVEAEIKANIGVLDEIDRCGKDLVKANHPKKAEIAEILEKLNAKWKKLNSGSEDKEKKLSQARDQSEFNEEVTEIMRMFDTIETAIKSTQMGDDLPSSKNLIEKHNDIEAELANKKEKLQRLKEKANAMMKDGHFDKNRIMEEIKKLEMRCSELTPIANQRKKDLQNNLKWHQFAFDVDQEMQWIEEHRPLAALSDCGRSLDDSVKLANKHKKLLTEITGHKPAILKLLNHGNKLVEEIGPMYKKDIEGRCQELRDTWQWFEQQAEDRRYKLELSEKGHQLLSDCSEIDIWITEKSYLVNQSDQNLDMDHLVNRVTKLKSMHIDLGTYDNLLKEISGKVNDFDSKCDKSKLLSELVEAVDRKYNDVSEKFDFLKESLNKIQKSLEESRDFKNFQSEVTDIESWIDEKLRIADNNEYGEDLQQMEHLRERWNNQLAGIDAGKDRIASCNKMADQLVKNRNPHSEDIESLQDDVNREWNRLLDFSAKKNSKFDSADEIHKFNKMCKELSDLMDLNNISVPPIHCKDRNALNSDVKRYETFEYELDNIKTQLSDVKEVAKQLKEKYPNNAEFIQLEVDHLEDMWSKLRKFTDARFAQLQDTQSYLDLCDEMKLSRVFFNEVNFEIKADRNIGTVLAADEQLKLANSLRDKLDSKEDYYRKLVSYSEDVISSSTCQFVEEIQKSVDDILEEKMATSDSLNRWIDKSEKVLLQQKILRDIQQINSSTSFQTAKMKSNYNTLDLEETEKLLNEHRNLSHNIGVTDDRLKRVAEVFEDLKKSNHFDVKNLSVVLNDCIKRRQQLHDQYGNVDSNLVDQLSWLKFLRETDDLKLWCEEKLQQIKTLDKLATNLEEKLLLLQKYKAFDAEITANQPEFEKLKLTVSDFVKNKHQKSPEIKEIHENIVKLWEKLLAECKLRSTALKETKDLLTFLDELDAVEAWLREKEFLVSANELGTDLDHCESLQAKLNEPVGGKQMDEGRIDMITKVAENLLKQKTIPQSEAENVKERTKSVENRWKTLKAQLDAYTKSLDEAHKMHKYYNDLSLLGDQIDDRLKMVKVKDLGSDVTTVEKLKRRQDAIDRDIVVLKDKFQALKEQDSFADNLDVQHSLRISLKQKEINDNLELLTSLAAQRTDLLNLSQRYFKIKRDASLLTDLSNKQSKEINESGWPNNVKTAKEALKANDEVLADMNVRKIKEKRVSELSSKLKINRDAVKDTVTDKDVTVIPTDEQLSSILNSLAGSVKETQKCWGIRQERLAESLQLYEFVESCELEEQWIQSQDKRCDLLLSGKDATILSVEDANERMEAKRSIDSIVSTREKKTIKGSLVESLEKLRGNKIKELPVAEEKYKELLTKLSNIKEKLSTINLSLTSEKQFQDLLQRVSDHISWIRNKTIIAADSNYEDKINLLNKIKKHKEFMSEVKANEPDICSAIDFGKALLKENHPNSVEIESNVTELESSWKNLLSLGDFKLLRLKETSDQVLWARKVEEFASWLETVENNLESHDYGNDLISVEILKRKQHDIEVDINSHKEQIHALQSQAEKMITENNYLSPEIKTEQDLITNKFNKLSEFLKIHGSNLADAEALYQFTCDINYETDWIQDKLRLTKKNELGSTMTEAIRFDKQHNSLMSEINARASVIKTMTERGRALEAGSHFAVDKIRPMYKDLEMAYKNLIHSAEQRATDLSDNMAYQEFDSGMKDIDLRMSDKISMLGNLDLGNDEQSCQQLIKKIDSISLEIETETTNARNFHHLADQLAEKYRSPAKDSLKSLDRKLEEVTQIIHTKRIILIDSIKYYQFVREIEEFLTWIKDQNSLVLIEDYGNDYDDCMNLLDNFATYNQTLNANAGKVKSLKDLAKQLILEKNPFSSRIENYNTLLTENMTELRENFKIRKEALQGALEVHMFSQESNDLLDWIKNKNIEISSLKQSSGDKLDDVDRTETRSDKTEAILGVEFYQPLSVIRNIENNFNKFERDLEAVKNQIGKMEKESNRLQNEYPDAKEHISEKANEVEKAWNKLNNAVKKKKVRLTECKQLQTWLIQYKDLLNWAKAHNAKITSDESLPIDVEGAERLLSVNNEQKLEIDSKTPQLTNIMKIGDDIKRGAKYISQIMDEKQAHLTKVWHNMCDNLKQRRDLYEQNLDLRRFLVEMHDLDKWLTFNENKMKSIDETSFKNVLDIDEAVKNHDDFMKYVAAEQARFNTIKRVTLLEDTFNKRKAKESKEIDSLWSEDLKTNVKRRETQRILEERRRDVDQRRANEPVTRVSSSGKLNATVPEVADLRSKKQLKKQASTGQLDLQASPVKSTQFALKINSVEEEDSIMESDIVFPKGSSSVKKTTSFSTKKREPIKGSRSKMSSQMSGCVVKKQIKSSKGIKAPVRTWKDYFAVLKGHMLDLYKDKNAYTEQPDRPLMTHNIKSATFSVPSEYTKRTFVLHVRLEDLSEFYLQLENNFDMKQWSFFLDQNSKLSSEDENKLLKPKSQGPMISEKTTMDLQSSPIDVSRLIDEDLIDSKRASSSSREADLPQSPPVVEKPQATMRQKNPPKAGTIDRPQTQLHQAGHSKAGRPLSHLSASLGSPRPGPLPGTGRQVPVPAALLRSRQLASDAQSVGDNEHHKSKSKSMLSKLFSRRKDDKTENKDDEV